MYIFCQKKNKYVSIYLSIYYITIINDFDNIFSLPIISLNKFVCKACRRNWKYSYIIDVIQKNKNLY